jgi:choline dehydrogenase-like flavoprotein
VLLSGGTYNSPQLLMLSGIGPAAHLAEMGIPLVHDLPGVGRNLAEHPRVPLEFAAKALSPSSTSCASTAPRARWRMVPVRHRPVRAPAQQRQPDAAHRPAARAARHPAVLEPGEALARTCGFPAS